MIPNKQIAFKGDARGKIKAGIDVACDAVKATIGPKGRNAFIDNEALPKITNDGVSIALAIALEDRLENMGAWLVKNTSSQTNDDAGDGTSTTAVLLQAIINEALKRPENPMDIKRSLSEAGEKVTKAIKDMAKPVKDSQIESVATISSESKEIGKLLSDIIEKVGHDVPITIEDNKFPETEYEIAEGLETKVGYAHNAFITNQAEGTAELTDTLVFATDRRISSIPDLQTLLELCQKEKITSLVFLVSDMENPVLGTFVLNKVNSIFNSLIIKVRGNELEDMAAACGATLISEASGIKFKDITLEHLGRVKRIVATEKKTTIIADDSPVRQKAIGILKAAEANTKNIYEAKHLNKRMSALQGGIAVIRVGAHTDSEREYLKFKIEDAVNATKSALEEGLVEGGGMCLYRIANQFKGNSIGESILRNALKEPLKAIIENAGEDYATTVKRMPSKKGYNADNGKMVDMMKEGIVDPAKVTRCAFQNALSSASTFITTDVAITDLIKPEHDKR